jgi:hypothetical protein
LLRDPAQRREAFRSACRVRPGTGDALGHDEIVFPDGQAMLVAPRASQPVIQAYYDSLTAEHASRAIVDYTQRRGSPLPEPPQSEIETWTVRLFQNEAIREFDVVPDSWPAGIPTETVLPILNDLAVEGWCLIHVSEDRTVVDARSEPYRVRYMLQRG